MYLSNKYTIVYNSIINRAKARVLDGYSEKHHIIPKCLGGTDRKENLVRLTAREHFICHRLLVKMVEGKAVFQMIKAVDMMTTRAKCQDRYRVPSRLFEKLKKEASLAMSVLTKGIKKHSDETKQKMSESAMGRESPFKGKTMTSEQRERVSKVAKQRTPLTCHCGKSVDPLNFRRWHGNNCKSLIS